MRDLKGLRALVALTLAPVLLHAVPAQATSIVSKTLADLCNEADLAFVGTVGEVRSQWTDGQEREIETLVGFTEIDSLRGAGDGSVTLRFGGGQVGDLRQEIGGMPRFAPGQRLVIFARHGRSINPIVGFHQGCLRVVDGPAGPVILSADWRPITGIENGKFVHGDPDAGPGTALTLSGFLETVRSLLGQETPSPAR